MCVFKNYILLQEELRELQKVTIQVNKNYNNELRLFQSANIIDSYNAERVKQKFDELMRTNEKISAKENELKNTEKQIQDYLHAMNGMAIRYAHDHQGITMPMIFELGVNTYGETEIKMSREA
jgi:DNA repair exonuclease SbcCD ATPase subunit